MFAGIDEEGSRSDVAVRGRKGDHQLVLEPHSIHLARYYVPRHLAASPSNTTLALSFPSSIGKVTSREHHV